MKNRYLAACLVIFFALACTSHSSDELQFAPQNRPVPSFNVDSAYQKLAEQVKVGPRHPGSKGHRKVRTLLVQQLQQYADERNVFVQEFTHVGYEGDTLHLANIIAAFNPTAVDRIMLCAHWDTRPRADQDPQNPDAPIPGADDGASGVAVLLELARLFEQNPPPIGVDIVLFDGEDYGKEGDTARYFLGSRYWAENPPVKNYNPRFAILLDMVGGKEAQFPQERYSMQYAPALVNELWGIGQQKGYEALFLNQQGAYISDDHVMINQLAGIPAIDIVRHSVDKDGSAQFAPYWHTHKDNLDIIDKNTLKAVGEVLAELVYNRI